MEIIGKAIAGNGRMGDGTTLAELKPDTYGNPLTDWVNLLIAESKAETLKTTRRRKESTMSATNEDTILGDAIKRIYPWAKYVRMDNTTPEAYSVVAYAEPPRMGEGQWHGKRFSPVADIFDDVRDLGFADYLRQQDWATWGLDLTGDEVTRL